MSLLLLAGLAPGASAQNGLCGSPTPVPTGTAPPVAIETATVFEFTQQHFTVPTSGPGTATVTVRKTGAGAESVDYETADDTLTAPGGYTHTAGTLHFASGETAKSFTVPVSGESGRFRVFLSNASGGAAACHYSQRPWGSTVNVVFARPPGLSLSRSRLNMAENGSASYTVKLNTWPIGGDVTVTVGGTSGTDVTVDTDPGMAGNQNTLTFPAEKHSWYRPQTVRVRAGDDIDTVWDRVTLTHTASGANYGSVTRDLPVVVDDDDDDVPIVQFAQAAFDTGEGISATIRVRRVGTGAVTVDYATSDGTATAPGDYTAASGTLSFAAGETEKTITIPIIDDNATDLGRRESNEAFTVTLSNPSGVALGSQSTATVKINRPGFTFTSTDYFVREDRGPAVITVRKTGPGVGWVEYLTTLGGGIIFTRPTADPPDDRPIVEGALTFAADETEKSFTVLIVNDGVNEPDEQFGVALRYLAPNVNVLGVNRARVTIENYPPAPVLGFKSQESALHSIDVQENAGSATFTVVKTGGATSQTVTVDYRTVSAGTPGPRTATAPGDYTETSGTLTFAPSETEKTITIPIMDDDINENREQFFVYLQNPTGAVFNREFLVLGNLLVGAVNLIDDDPLPVIGFARAVHTVHEGDGTAAITVTKTGATARLVRVNYATADATATAPDDYTETSGTLEFAPSETEKTITVPLAGDGVTEDPETFSVTLSNPWRATLGRSLTYLLVNDGDAPTSAQRVFTPPAVTISADAASVTEGGSATFTVTADPAPGLDLPVKVRVAGEMGEGLYYIGIADTHTVTIPAGETSATLTVTAMSDEVERADGTMQGSVSPGDMYTVGSPSSVSLALIDDDGAQDGTQAAQAQTRTPAIDPDLVAQVRALAAQVQHGAAHVKRWRRVLIGFGLETYAGLTAMTASEAQENAERHSNPLWPKIAKVLAKLEAAPGGQETPPAVVPAVTVAAGSAVTEGGDAVFTLTASPAPSVPLAVSVSVATEGAYGVTAGSRTVTIPKTGSATLALATADDAADEPDGSVSVTVADGTGYTAGSPASGTVAVRDDDLPPPVVSVAADTASITEGGDAAFTVTADRTVGADLTVRLTVAETGGGDHVGADNEGAAAVTFLKGETEAAFTVATVDDAADEPDGTVTVSLSAGAGYVVASPPGHAASVTVADNDAAALPVLSVADATAREGVDWMMTFTVRLSASAARAVEVLANTRDVSTEEERDYWPLEEDHRLRFAAGETAKQVQVLIYDDSHNEDPETFELVLSEAVGAEIGDGVAVGTIVNDDPMPAAYLARFGRTVAEQALDAVAGRMAAPRTPGMEGSVAGHALSFGASGNDAPALAGPDAPVHGQVPGTGFGGEPHPRLITTRELLLGSSFTQTGEKDASGGSFAFWGRASQGGFDGVERGDGTDVRLDGAVTTGMLGADYARGNWLVGLALARSSADGDYAAPGGAGEEPGAGDGEVESSLTAAIPYAALEVSERLKLWGAAGYGSGEVTLKTASGDHHEADTTWSMAAAGLRGGLLKPGEEGFGLALLADALWTRTDSDKTRELVASASEVNRLRLGIEGSRAFALKGGGSVKPRVELGLRHDGGDAETGFGVEVGGGVTLTSERLGLVLDLSGRALLAHEAEDFRDRGVSVSLTFDPAPGTKRGASFALRRDLGGSASGGLDALFAAGPLSKRAGGGSGGWRAEAAWGLPAFGGRFTGSPFLAWGFSAGARDYDLGWRLEPEASGAPDLSLAVKAKRREATDDTTDHGVGVDLTARW